MQLVIGNKNYSSWSLRAWLFLKVNGIDFEEIRISLSTPDTAKEIARYNKAGKVPVLHDNGLVIWDSLAICEYVSERYLDGAGWPSDPAARAVARSCSAEMHSGFFALREMLPMNCRAEGRRIESTPALSKEIARIDSLWTELRGKQQDSPWLFDQFSIADCMFAPVVFRFATYGIQLSPIARQYVEHLLNNDMMQHWLNQATKEHEIIESCEVGE